MTPQEQAKVRNFMNDVATSKIVYDVIRDAFLKSKPNKDVQFLAAERLAVDLLQEAWKDLARYRDKEDNEKAELKQIGL